jgi:hypothetical protein
MMGGLYRVVSFLAFPSFCLLAWLPVKPGCPSASLPTGALEMPSFLVAGDVVFGADFGLWCVSASPISAGMVFFRSLAFQPAVVDPFSSPLFHKLAADGWLLWSHHALESLVKIGGGPKVDQTLTSMPDLGAAAVAVSSAFRRGGSFTVCGRTRVVNGSTASMVLGPWDLPFAGLHPQRGGWGGLDAGEEEDRRAGAAWPAPEPEKRGVRPRLRTTTSIRYRFHLKPLCEGSFFGLGSVLAPSCFGDRLVDGLVKTAALPVSTGDPWDLLVFCCFSMVLCVVWLQPLYPPYPLRRRLYWYVFMDVFLTV